MAWEFAVLDALQTIHTPVLDAFFTAVTMLGRDLWVVLGVFLLFFRRTRVCGVCVLASLLAGALLTNVLLKPLVARPRPCWVNDAVQLLVSSPKDYSFPSGHSQAGFAAASAIFWSDRRWGAAALAAAALVAFSRLYLYVHFPTDVLAGIAIGFAVGTAASRLVKAYARSGSRGMNDGR